LEQEITIMQCKGIVVACVIGILALARPVLGQDAAAEARQLAEKADQLAREKKLEEAVAAARKAIQLAPKDDRYLALASEYEMRAGKYADGLEHALQALKINDKVGGYYVLAAGNALGNQDLDRAREYCDRILKGGPDKFGEGACNNARVLLAKMAPHVYTVHWDLDPSKGRLAGGTLAVALPKDGLPNQSTTYEIKGARSHRLIKGASNDVLQITPDAGKPMVLTTRVTVRPYSFKKELAEARTRSGAAALPADARAYLAPALTINPRSPALVKAAAPLKGKDNLETAANILAWMKKNIKYDAKSASVGQVDFRSVEEVLERGHAECRGYAMLFTALCRAAGVPARPIWGLTRVQADQDQRFGGVASHSWVEFYIPGCGWVPADPQVPASIGFLPTSHLRIMVDTKKSRASLEDLPLINLVNMNGGKVKFDETVGDPGEASPSRSSQRP
jgi:tetratricopeptide (TPR) repeat protein